MRFASASSTLTDAYRAGNQIGEILSPIAPDVVILFASVTYDADFSNLFAGVRDSLGNEDVLIFGGTGDGIYETSRASHYGVCALGIDSGDGVRWTVASETGISEDSFSAARRCAEKAAGALPGKPSFVFVLADGTCADGSKIVEGVGDVIDAPFFGGLTGDDRKFTRSRLLVDGQFLSNAVAILAATGDFPYSLHAASGWTPVGVPGIVEASEKNVIRRIDGRSAQDFVQNRLGKPLAETDLGIVPLATYDEPGGGHFFLRSPSHIAPESGAITMFGSIAEGASVRACAATREEVLRGARDAVEGAVRTIGTPGAALIVSCAGRKWLLEDPGSAEIAQALDILGRKVPMAGFPSFGEIGPFRGRDGSYSDPFFHNVTFVICVFGE